MGALARAVLVLLATALAAACASEPPEVVLTVESHYALPMPEGVDRYEVSVYRRGPDRRWHLVPGARRYFALPGSTFPMSATSGADGGGASYEPTRGTHTLRPEGVSPDDPVLVIVRAGATRADDRFVPRGLPAVAQFAFPSGRGQLTLALDPLCEALDPLGREALSPYYACVVDAGCATFDNICVQFNGNGNARRVRCDEQPARCGRGDFDGGGAACVGCVAPVAVDAVDGGAPIAQGAMVPSGQAVPFADCTGDEGGQFETCGTDGTWSRCLETSPCAGQRTGEACCPPPSPEPGCSPESAVALCAGRSVCQPSGGGSGFACLGCGGEGAACCDGDPQCDPGLACAGGRCICGYAAGAACCADGLCGAAGLACAGGVCVHCGQPGEPCCAGDACAGDTRCLGGACQSCGGAGEPCCPGGAACGSGLTCASGTCVGCGGAGESCCPASACGAGLSCIAGSCAACGGAQQACCPGGTPCGPNLACGGDGRCAACGYVGTPCCAGSCLSGAVCDASGTCQACGGGAGAPCCPGPSGGICGGYQLACYAGNVCMQCGHNGQLCCPTGLCQEDGGHNNLCDGTNHCAFCGQVNEPCCPGHTCHAGQTCAVSGDLHCH